MNLRRAAIFSAAFLLASLPVGQVHAARKMTADAFDSAIQTLYEDTQAHRTDRSLGLLRTLYDAGQLNVVPLYVVSGAVTSLMHSPSEASLLEFAAEVAASDRFSKFSPNLQIIIALPALTQANRKGDLSGVDKLLAAITYPDSFISILTDRDYAPIWPAAEAYAGDNLSNVLDRYLALSRNRLQQNPKDRDRFGQVSFALLEAGKYEELVASMRDWRRGRTSKDELQEGDGWSMYYEATALNELGRKDEADAILRELAELPQPKYPWMVNFAINRLAIFATDERWQDVLSAVDNVERVTKGVKSSVYAKMLVAQFRTCALYGLGRQQEAADDLKFLRGNADRGASGSLAVVTETLLCAGQQDEAEARLLKALTDGKTVTNFQQIIAGQDYEGADPPVSKTDVAAFIMSRPALKAEVLKHIRLLPTRLTPLAYVRQKELRKKKT